MASNSSNRPRYPRVASDRSSEPSSNGEILENACPFCEDVLPSFEVWERDHKRDCITQHRNQQEIDASGAKIINQNPSSYVQHNTYGGISDGNPGLAAYGYRSAGIHECTPAQETAHERSQRDPWPQNPRLDAIVASYDFPESDTSTTPSWPYGRPPVANAINAYSSRLPSHGHAYYGTPLSRMTSSTTATVSGSECTRSLPTTSRGPLHSILRASNQAPSTLRGTRKVSFDTTNEILEFDKRSKVINLHDDLDKEMDIDEGDSEDADEEEPQAEDVNDEQEEDSDDDMEDVDDEDGEPDAMHLDDMDEDDDMNSSDDDESNDNADVNADFVLSDGLLLVPQNLIHGVPGGDLSEDHWHATADEDEDEDESSPASEDYTSASESIENTARRAVSIAPPRPYDCTSGTATYAPFRRAPPGPQSSSSDSLTPHPLNSARGSALHHPSPSVHDAAHEFPFHNAAQLTNAVAQTMAQAAVALLADGQADTYPEIGPRGVADSEPDCKADDEAESVV